MLEGDHTLVPCGRGGGMFGSPCSSRSCGSPPGATESPTRAATGDSPSWRGKFWLSPWCRPVGHGAPGSLGLLTPLQRTELGVPLSTPVPAVPLSAHPGHVRGPATSFLPSRAFGNGLFPSLEVLEAGLDGVLDSLT